MIVSFCTGYYQDGVLKGTIDYTYYLLKDGSIDNEQVYRQGNVVRKIIQEFNIFPKVATIIEPYPHGVIIYFEGEKGPYYKCLDNTGPSGFHQ